MSKNNLGCEVTNNSQVKALRSKAVEKSLQLYLLFCGFLIFVTGTVPIAGAADQPYAAKLENKCTAQEHPSGRCIDWGIYVTITSLVDELKVSNLVVNRGRCDALFVKFPLVILYGDQFTFRALCRPIELKVFSNHGDVTVAWQP